MKWFSTWFDSPYYHILYDQRDENEASAFIKAIQDAPSEEAGITAVSELARELAKGVREGR